MAATKGFLVHTGDVMVLSCPSSFFEAISLENKSCKDKIKRSSGSPSGNEAHEYARRGFTRSRAHAAKLTSFLSLYEL